MYRVRSRATFAELSRARPRRHGAVWIRQARLHHGGPPQVAYSVSRAVGNAVIRNRVRRRLRAVMSARATSLVEGHGYLVGATPGAVDQTVDDLGRSIDMCLAANRG